MTSIAGKVPFEPDKNDPWQGDKLDRKKFAEALKPILADLASPATIGLLGNWGSGKTNFLRRLEADLNNQDGPFVVVYFNAWARDFSDDPLASFTAALEVELKSNDATNGASVAAGLREKSIELLKTGVAGALRVGGEMVGAAVPVAGGMIEKGAELLAKKIQDDAEKAPDARKAFRKELDLVVKSLSSGTNGSQNRRLLIFVDELDRCRPDYAIRLLETIKHFFDVSGVSFLLAYDGVYLESAAKALYGQSFDAEQYLRKFIDVRFWLPPVDHTEFVRDVAQHYGFGSAFGSQVHQAAEMQEHLVEWVVNMELRLRDAEQALAQCRLLLTRLAGKVECIRESCMFLLIARFAEPQLVQDAINGDVPFDAVANRLAERFGGNAFFSTSHWRWIKAQFLFADKSGDEVRSFLDSTAGGTDESKHAISAVVNALRRYPWGDVWRDYLNMVR